MTRRTLATLYGVGLVRKAPGTAGSLVAALLAWPILLLPHGWEILAAGTVLFTVLGTFATTRYMGAQASTHDPKEVVVDELAGQWLTYLLMPGYTVLVQGADDALRLYQHAPILATHLVAGFVLFRFFDILKPWPISWADRKVKGGFGVMFDDLLAAIPAGILLYGVDLYALIAFHPFD